MRTRPLVLCLAIAAALAACDRAPAPAAGTGAAVPATAAATHAFSGELSKDDFAEMVKTMASDAFEGRAPGSPGGEMTVEYIKAQYERIGLEPGGDNGSFFQTVPMVETTADESTVLRMDVAGKPSELTFGTDMVIGTRTGEPKVSVSNSDLVFVGYGVDAPELGWNDYAGLDVKGKTVVILVNDPGFHAKDAALFEGERMTYYGRWTYKFEEAARKGAAAALIIHDTAGASYGWDVVKNSWSGPQFDLRASDDPEPRLPAQGWLSAEAATTLFADAGQDLKALYAAASKPGFKAVPLDARVSFDLASTSSEKSSRNVVGILRGSEKPDEAIAYIAHWDHLGKHEGEGDQIYNGAVDNATGVAGIIEIAEKFKADGQPKRSVAFIAVTLEESGLLGSKYQVAHPVFPLAKTVGVINLDAMSVAGPAHDMVVVGKGSSQLEDVLKTYTDAQQRTQVLEGNPAGGFYFRSDHFNYAKAGVPALYAKGGDDLVQGGKDAGAALAKTYNEVAYHKPGDEFDPGWNLDGVIQDLEALYGVGRTLADDGSWPAWYEGNAFKAARDAMRAD
ncbi:MULTISPECIES: M28 family metallopeptidase [unclassified Luteimonas]|uniref:M28 family metallopeptidase n=1 Tax=unclassified Luteimonas TaxID=2629088 RepID=UPI001601061B|nr:MULTISPECIES: M28 family metallopeptidase [unclassified Luteimonas]MBB1473109.1 M28 family peptidase [Luteimonas sp. MC1782]MBB6598187.1 M28 family peptidase [Luteimonas sp. MC1825]QOC88412.1 M28 family peptidase [Luteimonas sp. MC1825]